MRRRFLKSCFSLGIVIVCLMGLLSSLSWYLSGNKLHLQPLNLPPPPQNLCDDSVILSLITDRVDKEWWTGRITQLLEDRRSPSSRPNCAQVAGETETFIWAHHQMESRLPLCHREITDKVNRSYAQTLEKKEDKSKI
ncbi:hypothetical protein D4764_18G0010810 [Takifugu flavidus]|uniref:Uncharacterized protein n=1 Tax=Takifugu flavidus TaxID=433684 RepID=A0A5C6NTE5_9TELE|nr:hypothetical protein D4764_18G0010810 [Takifugu flavidus]